MNFSAFTRTGILLLLLLVPIQLFAQDPDEEYYESFLKQEVDNENIVYRPVIGFGYGYVNFLGEVRDKKFNPLMGTPAYKINVSTFLDTKHYFRANFSLLFGQMGGTKVSLEPAKNLNFRTDLTTFGINLHYDFQPIVKPGSIVTPFISVGIENVQFNSKSDLKYFNEDVKLDYNYWSDGTIRDGSGNIIKRDYIYETDLRDLNLYGLGSYNQSTFAIPIEIGLDFKVSERLVMRMGHSFHYTFTDNIDNISSKATTGIKGNKLNDMFGHTFVSFHFDIFTSDKTITIQKMFADVEGFDYALLEDNDNDGHVDIDDKCLNHPAGLDVDSVGCPFDDDKDGIPNYADKELNTRLKAMVDNNGVEINADKLGEELASRQGINRSEVESFLMMQRARMRYNMGKSAIPIPQRYKRLDKDKDDYISFDELLDAIDEFFDGSPDLKSAKDIHELNDFFFAQ